MTDTKPWRMIVRGAFTEAWMNAPQAEKNEVFAAWTGAHAKWVGMGAEMIATLDDELSMVGVPRGRGWNFYSIWTIPDPTIVLQLLNLFRVEDAGTIRLDKYFTFETVVGHPIGGLERRVLAASE